MIHLLSETLRRSRDVGCCEPAAHEFTALEPTGAFAGGHLPNGRAPREAVTPLGQRGPRDSECGLFSQTLGSGSPARVGRAPLETTCSGPCHWVPASTESSADRARQAARGAVGSSAAGDSSQTPPPLGLWFPLICAQPPASADRATCRRQKAAAWHLPVSLGLDAGGGLCGDGACPLCPAPAAPCVPRPPGTVPLSSGSGTPMVPPAVCDRLHGELALGFCLRGLTLESVARLEIPLT